MKCDVITTERMRTACWHMIQDIERLDYIAAHNMEADKVYQDIRKALEEDLCLIESSVGEMRSDLSTKDRDERYRILLAEQIKREREKIFLADNILNIQSKLKEILIGIGTIPEHLLEAKK
jgi:hypothetical protein